MASESYQLVFRIHAVKRMFQRNFTEKEVREVIESGEIIESYPDDTPYPSRLMLGWYFVLSMSLRQRIELSNKRLSLQSMNQIRKNGNQGLPGGNSNEMCDL